MVEASTDKAKNRLTLRFSGRVTAAEMNGYDKKIMDLILELQPGFTIFTDLSKLDSMDLACAPHIERTMDFANKKGVKKVVRVIPDPQKDIGFNIMSLFHYRSRKVLIVTCETLAEAKEILA